MTKACECGAIWTDEPPVWCPRCSTFTHPVYAMPHWCPEFRPDHNGECLNCDEWIEGHSEEAITKWQAKLVKDALNYPDKPPFPPTVKKK